MNALASPLSSDASPVARRELRGLTASVERRALAWLAARTPAAVGPDHLTALGVLAMVAGGVFYALVPRDLRWLHGVNLALLLNWLGDSLDGTLARHRRRPRPRYGYYLDHLLDAVGALALLGGAAASGLVTPALAAALLVAYYLFSIHLYLATHAEGVFRIGLLGVGGTELRILLAAANVAALLWPRVALLGREVLLFDLVTGAGTAALLGAVAVGGTRTARALDRADRAVLAGGGPRH